MYQKEAADMTLSGYDEWKTHNPADDRCEFCGVDQRYCDGFRPDECTGDCGARFRDQDAEYDAMRDRDMEIF